MSKIVVTGGAGFVGSNLVKILNDNNIDDIIIVDSLSLAGKFKNLEGLKFDNIINYKLGLNFILDSIRNEEISAVFHIGANADVLEKNCDIFLEENYTHSKFWLDFAKEKRCTFIYASSSAVYGNGMKFKVSIGDEKPHNEYAFSKAIFDQYIHRNKDSIDIKWYGLRFFNVFGEGEYHKGNNASLPYRFSRFVIGGEDISLFDDEISRDYIYVKDLCSVLYALYTNKISIESGIYNLGSGESVSHKDVAELARNNLHQLGIGKESSIRKICMPLDLISRFQYFTLAHDMPQEFQNYVFDTKEKMSNYIRRLGEINEGQI